MKEMKETKWEEKGKSIYLYHLHYYYYYYFCCYYYDCFFSYIIILIFRAPNSSFCFPVDPPQPKLYLVSYGGGFGPGS